MQRLPGYVHYVTKVAREAISDLDRTEMQPFHNLFLPSVKLAEKIRKYCIELPWLCPRTIGEHPNSQDGSPIQKFIGEVNQSNERIDVAYGASRREGRCALLPQGQWRLLPR